MLYTLFVSVAVASNTSVSESDFDEMVTTLIPHVEAMTGRSFVAPPRSGIATRERLRRVMSKPHKFVYPPGYSPPPREPTAHEEALISRAMAVHVPSLDGVYLIKESMEEVVDDMQLAPEALRPLVRCIVIHELVHALQGQYGVSEPNDDDHVAGLLALREGHATDVAQRWCEAEEGPVITSLAASLQGTDVAASLAVDDPSAPYAWGAWLSAVLDEQGDDAIWAALAGPPPSWQALTQAAKPSLSPGWSDPQPLQSALASLGIQFDEGAEAVSPGVFLPIFVGVQPGKQAVPTALGGLSAIADDGRNEGVAAMFLFAEPDRARSLLVARGHMTKRWRDDGLYMLAERATHLMSVKSKSVGRLEKRPDVVDAMLVQARTDRNPYLEMWVATERVLGVVAFHGTADVSVAKLQGAVSTLLDALPPTQAPGQPTLGPLQSWLDGVQSSAGTVSHTASWQYRLHQAAVDIESGSTTACADRFHDVLVEGAVADPRPYAKAAFMCSATRDERGTLAQAMRWLEHVDPMMATFHAWALMKEHKFDKALALLDRTAPTDSDREARAVADARLSALLGKGRMRDAERMLTQGEGSPAMRARAAVFLLDIGRRSVARTVLTEVCPSMRGDERKMCKEAGF